MSIRSITLTLFTFALSAALHAQAWGVGFRLGELSGLTVKKYNGASAWEFNLGRAHSFVRDNYYYDSYARWYDRKHFGWKANEFLGYRATVPLALQVHYLRQKPVSGAAGLDWYYGVGGQVRWQSYDFDYRYKLQGENDWIYVAGERVTEVDAGVDGVIGLEYKFNNAPVSLFLDGTLFMEVVDDPFLFWFQGGLGARFRF